jgi:hypothetical protein
VKTPEWKQCKECGGPGAVRGLIGVSRPVPVPASAWAWLPDRRAQDRSSQPQTAGWGGRPRGRPRDGPVDRRETPRGIPACAAIGHQIKVGSRGVALGNALQGEIEILQAALLDFRAGEGIERIHRHSLHAPASTPCRRARTAGHPGGPWRPGNPDHRVNPGFGHPSSRPDPGRRTRGHRCCSCQEHHPRKFHGHGGSGGQRAYFQSAGVGGAGGGRRRSGARRAQGTPR